jgi:hypothetical protein
MKSNQKKSFWASLWRILRPVATLGISLLVGSLSKKSGTFEDVVNIAGTGVGEEVLQVIDDTVKSDNIKVIKQDSIQ